MGDDENDCVRAMEPSTAKKIHKAHVRSTQWVQKKDHSENTI